MSVRVLLSMSISAPAMEAKRSSQFRLPNRWPSTAAAIITTPMQELMTTWVPLSPCHVLQQQLGVIHEHIGDDESGQGQSHRLPACFHGTAAGQTRRSEGGQGHRGGQVGEHGKVEAEQMGGQLRLAQLHQSGGGDGGGDQIGGDGGQAHAQDHAGDHGEHQSEQHALLDRYG